MRRILPASPLAVTLALLFSLALVPVPVAAAGPAEPEPAPVVTADLDGTPIPVDEIPDHFCHDLDFPAIHCFSHAGDALAAVATATRPAGPAAPRRPRALSITAVSYVTVYSQPSYAGSFLVISQDYDALATVGWNDRARSFRGQNNERGRFWTDWFAGGTALDFCCNANVPSLSATFDQKISSVYRR